MVRRKILSTLLYAPALLLIFVATASAKDSSQCVCSGLVPMRDGQMPLAIVIYDRRAEDGESRSYAITGVVAENVFLGTYLDKGQPRGKVTLKGARGPLFKGRFWFLPESHVNTDDSSASDSAAEESAGPKTELELDGSFKWPSERGREHSRVRLRCVWLSY